MQNPIRVLGEDITYSGMEISMYIDGGTVRRAYPMYAVTGENGHEWRCAQETEGANLVAFKLWCSKDEVYICSEEEELAKIGLSKNDVKTKNGIGFSVDIKSNERP